MGGEGFGYENEKCMVVQADGPGLWRTCGLLDMHVEVRAVSGLAHQL